MSLCNNAAPLQAGQTVRFSAAAMADTMTKARYFSLLTCGAASKNGSLCLLFSRDMAGSEVLGVRSDDDGRSFVSDPMLSLPCRIRTRNGQVNFYLREAGVRNEQRPNSKWEVVHFATHNMAFLREGENYVWMGGQHGSNHSSVWHKGTGIWTASGKSWRWAADREVGAPKQASQWRGMRRLLNGFHEGCVEARRTDGLEMRGDRAACEFDGRLTLVKHEGEYLLYGRLNPTRQPGSRFVQMTRSSDLVHWGAFEPIQLEGYSPLQGDIYFLAATSNPVDQGSLVGLFPVVHRGVGCIGISLSIDGKRWAPAVPITRCATDDIDGPHGRLHDGRRSIHHAVSGIVQRGDDVLLFIHENVPGIVEGATLCRSPASCGPSRIVRYAIPEATFSRWTTCNLRVLRVSAKGSGTATGRRHNVKPCAFGLGHAQMS